MVVDAITAADATTVARAATDKSQQSNSEARETMTVSRAFYFYERYAAACPWEWPRSLSENITMMMPYTMA